MKKLLWTIIGLFIQLHSFSQKLSVNQVPELIGKSSEIRYHKIGGEKRMGFSACAISDSTDKLYEISKEYHLYIDYLIITYGREHLRTLNKYLDDSVAATKMVYDSLNSIPLLKECVSQVMYVYCKEHHTTLKGYQPPPKQHKSMQEIMTVASKFFYADGMNDDTSVSYHVCAGFNPFSMEGMKANNAIDAYIEAFCFANIMRNADTNIYGYYDYFSQKIKEIDISISAKPADVRLEYARQRMYKEMMRSKDLERMIADKYKEQKEFLPFDIE